MKNLGKVYSTSENVRKILRSLPKSWETKVTAIKEAKDLTKLPLDELVGSPMTHEITMKERMEEEERIEEESKKKKSIALKSITLEVDSDDEEALDEDDVAYFTHKYKNFIKRKKQFRKHFTNQKGEESKHDEIICYECKKSGHIRPDCPLLKLSKKSRKKAMKATWDDSDESANDEEVTNFCFRAHSDKEDEENEVILESPII